MQPSATREALAALPPAAMDDPIRQISTGALVIELARKAGQLARAEVELARAEGGRQLRQELAAARALGIAAVCGLATLNLLLLALVTGLAQAGAWREWQGALAVAAAALAVGTAAGLWAWARRVERPLGATRRSLEEGLRWARRRME